MVLRNPWGGRRSVGGLFATVMDYFWREDSPWLVLQMPDGRRTAVLAAWTDLPAKMFPSRRRTPLLQPSVLTDLVELRVSPGNADSLLPEVTHPPAA